ncbi:hypothetical protein D3C73_1604790 [compost metagenome]
MNPRIPYSGVTSSSYSTPSSMNASSSVGVETTSSSGFSSLRRGKSVLMRVVLSSGRGTCEMGRTQRDPILPGAPESMLRK